MSRSNLLKSGIIVLIGAFVFASCNKGTSDSEKFEDITKTSSINIMKNMTVASMGLNDTINNIRGKLVFVRNVKKDDDNLNLAPSMNRITDDLKRFAKQVKALENMDRHDTNYYFHSVKSVYEYDDIISVLYEKKSHLSGTKDTITEILSYNYDKETEKEYSFKDIFAVNSDNIAEFNRLFVTNLNLEDLSSLVFNFEKDMVWIGLQKDGKIIRYGQPLRKVKKFLIDD
ncbi:MAG: hypothetical protein IJ759_01795 [Bacteroidales bacterium]|nr:hypothetical protein [Bacteroidales bacterium]